MLDDPLPNFHWRRDPHGNLNLEVGEHGARLIELPSFNKGTAFTEAEREALGLTGLLPPRIVTMAQQIERVLWTFQHQESDLERYLHLMGVLDRNETLFYRLLVDRFDELLPIVYTPTVGLACQHFGRIFRRARGLWVTPRDVDRIDEILGRWRFPNVRMIVLTDGERVLGLGDLGASGMGISIGKASLYVAGAGFHPSQVMPMCLDVGTENAALRTDPQYLGVQHPRLRGAPYEDLLDRLLAGLARRFPRAVVQFEDFASDNALRILDRYRTSMCCFNDDIQGTGAVTRAVVLAALRGTGRTIADLRVVIAGAGSAGTGIAHALAPAGIWLVDDRGLLTRERDGLTDAQRPLAREEPGGGLLAIVQRVRPHVLIGVTGVPGLFTREMVQALEGPKPLVLPLSNPTSNAECTPQQAREWSGGLAQVATGSPFAGTEQCNNVYVYPGVGLGVALAESTRVTPGMFVAAAEQIAAAAPPERLLPPLRSIRSVSRAIALAVAAQARAEGVAAVDDALDLERRLDDMVWEPDYVPYTVG